MKKKAYVGCLGVISLLSTEFGVVGILPDIAKFYNISIDKAGWLLSLFALTIAICGPFGIVFASKFSRKKVMLTALVLFLFSNIVSYFRPPFEILLIARIIPAILHPVFIGLALDEAISGAPKEMTHKVMSIVIGGVAIAQISIIPLASYIASITAWNISYLVQVFVNLASIIAVLLIFDDTNEKEKQSKSKISIQTILNKPFIISSMMNFFFIGAWFCTYSYFAEYMFEVKKMNSSEVSILLLIFGLFGVVSNSLAGKYLSKGITKVVLISVASTLFVPFILNYSSPSFYIVCCVVALWGLLFGSCFLIANAYMISAAPQSVALANTLQTTFGNLGVSVGVLLGGIVIKHLGILFLPYFGSAFGVISLLLVLYRIRIETKSK